MVYKDDQLFYSSDMEEPEGDKSQANPDGEENGDEGGEEDGEGGEENPPEDGGEGENPNENPTEKPEDESPTTPGSGLSAPSAKQMAALSASAE